MKQVRTVIRPISNAIQFDMTVNRLIEEGWELKTRKALITWGDISESFNFPACQVLYAELEREIEQFEEITL